jgi:hypothetical protein
MNQSNRNRKSGSVVANVSVVRRKTTVEIVLHAATTKAIKFVSNGAVKN